MDAIILLLCGAVLGLLLNVALMRNRIRALEQEVKRLWLFLAVGVAEDEELE